MKKKPVKATFLTPKQTVKDEVKRAIEKLGNELMFISMKKNNILALVDFYVLINILQTTEEYHELKKMAEKKSLTGLAASLETLCNVIRRYGYDRDDMNRVTKGETTTPSQIYLGGKFGLDINTADYWLSYEKSFKKQFHKGQQRSVWEVVHGQIAGNALRKAKRVFSDAIRDVKKNL